MSVLSAGARTAGRHTASRRLPRIFWLEAKLELLKLLRMPAYAVPTLAFPVMFYVLFGLSFGGSRAAGPVSMATYLLATYGAFGVIGAALFGFGVGVAVERGQGWMLVKRASPMPVAAYFWAKMAMSLLFATAIVGLLFVLGSSFGGVSLAPVQWLSLAAVLVAGALPFCAFGLAVGYFAGPNSAVALVNLVYLPMAFASGLWIPVMALPELVQRIAPFLPAYHFAQLALATIGASQGGPVAGHLAYLVGFTAFFLLLAGVGYRRDEDRTYG